MWTLRAWWVFQKMTVTDDSREVEWQAGGTTAPVASARAEHSMGRVHEISARTDFGRGEGGSFGTQVDYAFSSSEGRALIKKVAQEQGWSERMGPARRWDSTWGSGPSPWS